MWNTSWHLSPIKVGGTRALLVLDVEHSPRGFSKSLHTSLHDDGSVPGVNRILRRDLRLPPASGKREDGYQDGPVT